MGAGCGAAGTSAIPAGCQTQNAESQMIDMEGLLLNVPVRRMACGRELLLQSGLGSAAA